MALPFPFDRLIAGAAEQAGGTLLGAGSTLSLAALAVTLGLLGVLAAAGRRPLPPRVVLRALFPRRLIASASGRTDIGWALFSLSCAGAAIGWALVSGATVAAWVSARLGPAPAPWLPGWAAAAVLTLAVWLTYELAYWIDHWLSHKVPLLWRFHAVHHSAEHLSLLTNFRVHPVETIKFYNLTALAMGAASALAGHALGGARGLAIGQTNLLIYATALGVTHLQHSHLWLRFGERGGRWLLGPAHHQVHHSRERAHHDRNFGSVLAIWDRLFGTFHMPGPRREVRAFGVDGLGYDPHSVARGLAMPLLGLFRTHDASSFHDVNPAS